MGERVHFTTGPRIRRRKVKKRKAVSKLFDYLLEQHNRFARRGLSRMRRGVRGAGATSGTLLKKVGQKRKETKVGALSSAGSQSNRGLPWWPLGVTSPEEGRGLKGGV